jgi:hypothetical protein
MTNTATTHRTCTHLPREYFAQLAGQLWCVQCDGNVNADGTVIPRACTAAPVKRNYGARLERFLGQRISLQPRSYAAARR